MGKYPTGPQSCEADPSCDVLVTSVTQTFPLIVYSFWALVIICCTSFQLWKLFLLSKFPVSPLLLQQKGTNKEFVIVGSSEEQHVAKNLKLSSFDAAAEIVVNVEDLIKELRITGYTRSVFGEFCYFLCCLTSLHWLVLHVVLLIDVYNKCQVGGVDNLCFYGNYFIFGSYGFNGQIFFVVWWLSAIWFTAWVICKGRVRYWFRLPCSLQNAEEVFIWTRESEQFLSTNDLPLVHFIRYIRNKLTTVEELQGHSEIVKILTTKAAQKHFFHQGHRFLLKNDTVVDVRFKVGQSYADFHKEAEGLSDKQADTRLEELGLNEIPFKPESLFRTIFDETFTLFRVYQLISYILQFWSSYLFVGSLMMSIVLLSAAVTIYNRRRGQFTIAKITEYVTEVEVLRSQQWVKLDSRNLVPGDVIRLRSNWVLPCDLLIIKGSCVCDESALTGEPMPVQKYAAPDTDAIYKSDGAGSKHTLFSGTTILQAGSQSNDDVQAIVTQTGMATSKGELVATILYPQKLIFKYDEELQIVALLLLLYAMVCFGISIKFQNLNGQQSIWVTKWIYCMFIINQIMSPLLPLALEVGQLHALERLKKRGVFCLNPRRIAIAGKIRVFCFDKTGTLTKEGLDFVGIQSVSTNKSFGSVLPLGSEEKIDETVLHGLATCHAVTKFGKELVGNQVEVKMFSAAGWNLVESAKDVPVVSDSYGSSYRILRRNEFDQSRATMSVVVQDNAGEFHVYCKGSFEKIKDLSDPQSIPENFMDTANRHALEGCYVLGLSHRTLGRDLSLDDVSGLSRDEVEKNLRFIALILFRNELKSDSSSAIAALKTGMVRSVMVTGDNAQCGHYIAKQSGMISSNSKILLANLNNDNRVIWSPLSSELAQATSIMSTEELLCKRASLEDGNVELAVTGKAFNRLKESNTMDELLLFTRIFARFTPADKEKVVTMHRNHGLIVGMCGDGGNDCGALRAAHAGVALSAAEASVVSPFTAKNKSVQSVVDLLRESRGALHTSFACYKFLIIYGLQFSVFKLCCYWYGIIACQMDYIFIDGLAILSLGYSMTRSDAEMKLKKVRPTSSLLGPINVASVLGLWGSNVIFLIAANVFMVMQKDYVRWPAQYSHGASWWTLGDNWEATVLFFTMYFQFITSAFVFSFGSKFRRNVFSNFALMVSYGTLMVICSLLLLLPHNSFISVWHVASEEFNQKNPVSPVWAAYQQNGGQPSSAMPFGFRLRLWFLILSSLVVNILWQKVVVEGPIARLVAVKYPSTRPKLHI